MAGDRLLSKAQNQRRLEREAFLDVSESATRRGMERGGAEGHTGLFGAKRLVSSPSFFFHTNTQARTRFYKKKKNAEEHVPALRVTFL
jgi:hypothetical protein